MSEKFSYVVSCCCVKKKFLSRHGISLSQNGKLTSDTFAGVVSIYPSRALWSLPCLSRQERVRAEPASGAHVTLVEWVFRWAWA